MNEPGQRTAAAAEGSNFWGRHGVTLAWIATALLSLPALRAGFSLDDFMQRLVLEGMFPELGFGPATLYDFTGGGRNVALLVERGALPWLTDPGLELRFFRPLSSLSVALDHALFGRAALPSHLLQGAWFAAVTGLAIALFRRILTTNRAGLAAFLFALAGGHALNLTWIAGRHVLLGAAFGALALLVHVSNAEPSAGRRLPRWLAPISLIVAMFASETSLAALSLIASYELVVRDAPLPARIRGAAPWLVLALAYLGAYSAAGYTATGSGVYLSPLREPGAFLSAALTRVPILLGELAAAVPASLWGVALPARPGLAAFGALGSVCVVALALRGTRGSERRKVAWFAVGALAAAVPASSGVPDGRALLVAQLVSLPLVATAIDSAWSAPPGTRRGWLRAAAVVLSFFHTGLAGLCRAGFTELMVGVAEKQRALAESADFSRCEPAAPAFVVTGSDPGLSLSGGTSLAYYRPDLAARHPHLHVLSLAPHDQRIERTGERGIVLRVLGEPRRSTIFEELFRADGLVPGQRFALRGFSAEVLATERGLPARVAFELPPNACLVALDGGDLRGLPLPSPGKSLEFEHEPGPMGL